jgi:hypothetical protein
MVRSCGKQSVIRMVYIIIQAIIRSPPGIAKAVAVFSTPGTYVTITT